MKNKNVIAPKKVVTAKKKVESKNNPLKGSFFIREFILKKETHNNHATIIKLFPYLKKDMDAFGRLIKQFEKSTYLSCNNIYELDGIELTHYKLSPLDGLVSCVFSYFNAKIITICGDTTEQSLLVEYDLTPLKNKLV